MFKILLNICLLFLSFCISIPTEILAIDFNNCHSVTYHGPFGGDVRTITIDTANEDNILIGTAEGKIFFSNNSGQLWHSSAIPFRKTGAVIETIIQGVNKSEFFAGLRFEDGKGALWYSKDTGKTWSNLSLPIDFPAIRALLCISSPLVKLFAGTTNGLWVSVDYSKNWERTFVPEPSKSVVSLAVDIYNPQIIYAGTWRRAFRSSDYGHQFQPIRSGMAIDSHVFKLLSDPIKANNIFAATCGWVYHSSNLGKSWQIMKKGLSDRRIRSLACSKTNSNYLFAGTPSGLFWSINAGKNWNKGTVKNISINAIQTTFDGTKIFIGLAGGGFQISSSINSLPKEVLPQNDCKLPIISFIPSNKGLLSSRISAIDISKKFIFSSETYSEKTSNLYWGPVNNPLNDKLSIMDNIGKPLTIKILPSNSNKFAAIALIGTFKGLYISDLKRGKFVKITSLTGPIRKVISEQNNPKRLYAVTGKGFFTSRNEGLNWKDISPKDYHGECLDCIVDEQDNKTIFLTTLIGIYVSNNKGINWKNSSLFLPKEKTSTIVQDPFQPTHLFTLSSKGLYQSLNYGKSWAYTLSYNFPVSASFVLFYPGRKNFLFSNDLKNGGLYYSKNNGVTWNKLLCSNGWRINKAKFFQNNENDTKSLFLATSGDGLVSFILN